jgi:predicted PurR-regulated permease PerM
MADPKKLDSAVEPFEEIRPRPSTWLEKYGVIQMMSLLATIGLLSVLFLLIWWATLPGPRDVQTLLTELTGKAPSDLKADQALDLYAKLRQAHTQQVRDLFQLIVMSAIVPLFTLLAGYVFGKSKAEGGTGK